MWGLFFGGIKHSLVNGYSAVSCNFEVLAGEDIYTAAAAAKLLQSCPTLRDPMDCSLPGSSTHRIFQARVLEWGAKMGAFSVFSYGHTQNIPFTSGEVIGLLYGGFLFI